MLESLARLNPRFDGAFLNSTKAMDVEQVYGLNPRFDGAFLNLNSANKERVAQKS